MLYIAFSIWLALWADSLLIVAASAYYSQSYDGWSKAACKSHAMTALAIGFIPCGVISLLITAVVAIAITIRG